MNRDLVLLRPLAIVAIQIGAALLTSLVFLSLDISFLPVLAGCTIGATLTSVAALVARRRASLLDPSGEDVSSEGVYFAERRLGSEGSTSVTELSKLGAVRGTLRAQPEEQVRKSSLTLEEARRYGELVLVVRLRAFFLSFYWVLTVVYWTWVNYSALLTLNGLRLLNTASEILVLTIVLAVAFVGGATVVSQRRALLAAVTPVPGESWRASVLVLFPMLLIAGLGGAGAFPGYLGSILIFALLLSLLLSLVVGVQEWPPQRQQLSSSLGTALSLQVAAARRQYRAAGTMLRATLPVSIPFLLLPLSTLFELTSYYPRPVVWATRLAASSMASFVLYASAIWATLKWLAVRAERERYRSDLASQLRTREDPAEGTGRLGASRP